MMSFIENINALLRIGKNDTPAQRQIRQYEVVIGDYAIRPVQIVPGAIETAITKVTALGTTALSVIHCDRPPVAIQYRPAPVVPVTSPFSRTQSVEHLRVELLIALARTVQFFSVQISHRLCTVAASQGLVEPRQAHVATSSLGQRITEAQIGSLQQLGNVFLHHLFLQGHRCRRDHNLQIQFFGQWQSGQ